MDSLFFKILVASIVTFPAAVGSNNEKYSTSAGCFLSNNGLEPDLPFKAMNPDLGTRIESCVDYCRDLYYKVAGLQNGDCMCGSIFGQYGPAKCDVLCQGNERQICGGLSAISVYFTGHNAPGPVSEIAAKRTKILDRDDTLHLTWKAPEILNGRLKSYKIEVLNVVTAYGSATRSFRPRSWDVDAGSTDADMTGIAPGVEYNVSVVAENESGMGPAVYANVWSRVGVPPTPPFPKLVAKSNGKMTVELKPVEPTGGPISVYQVVVIDESSPVLFKPELLTDFDTAESEGTPYYIAAEIAGVYLPESFTVGDNRRYGKYWNKGLPDGRDFHVILGALSTLNGETRASYGRPGHEQHEGFHDGHQHTHGDHVHEHDHDDHEEDSGGLGFISGNWTPVTIALGVAIAVFGTMLCASVVIYGLMRRRVSRRRRRRRGSNMKQPTRRFDQQELTVSASHLVTSREPMDAAYVSSVFLVEEESLESPDGTGLRGVDKYERLKRKVWNIPEISLQIHPEVLGKGKFGLIKQGSVTKKGTAVGAAVHSFEDAKMSEAQKRSMLQDLELSIRMGSHMNLVHLIGLCEGIENIYVVVEYFPTSLKQYLLDSRNAERISGQKDKSLPVSSAGATHLLEVAVGIAMGMSHLASIKVTHRQLCAKVVSLVGGSVPKIGGISYSHYNSLAQAPDFTRWLPQEALKSPQYAFFPPKGDIWSFGVLLWEIATLGATPYGDIRSNEELMSRVMKGVRLAQAPTIEDEFYNLMASCWEAEVSERPTFHSLQAQLRAMAQNSALPQINFSYIGNEFRYEPYSPELEHLAS